MNSFEVQQSKAIRYGQKKRKKEGKETHKVIHIISGRGEIRTQAAVYLSLLTLIILTF